MKTPKRSSSALSERRSRSAERSVGGVQAERGAAADRGLESCSMGSSHSRPRPLSLVFCEEGIGVSEFNRKWLFRKLRHSLSLLAADGQTALAGVPDGCCKPEELALDFDNFRSAVLDSFAAELPPELVVAL